jgi:Anti-sigma-28 factor, FlgM
MGAERENKVTRLKDEIAQGTYKVDPTAVADAIVRRLREIARAGATPGASVARLASTVGGPQNKCS